ncbi:hypothetical protein GH714_011257 [Hevea brasiliensis]|uniref:Uncharacterized protein n=1 Tax=Hevea brasiliensis TaxID=3981 RepID=A0A6A6MLV6_HEVBR|nr:hypothetical protein GH714_011257 [Hevea brasiliensis]
MVTKRRHFRNRSRDSESVGETRSETGTPGRNMKAAEDTKARMVSECPDSEIIVMAIDLSSLNSVRNFVAEFESLNLPLNLLINNAGKFADEHAISEDGIEMTFATNYLGHFLLTKLLLRKMIETAKESGIQGRIVNVSSTIHGWFSGDMIQYLAEISGNKGYGVFHGVQALEDNSSGCATTCFVATHPRLLNVSGKYFADCNEASTSKLGSSSTEAARLWSASEIMVSTDANAVFDALNTKEYVHKEKRK